MNFHIEFSQIAEPYSTSKILVARAVARAVALAVARENFFHLKYIKIKVMVLLCKIEPNV